MHKIIHFCPENQTIYLNKEFYAGKLVCSTLLIAKVIYMVFSVSLISPVPSGDHGYDIFTISNVQMIAHGVII